MSNIPEDVLIKIEETANFIKQNGLNCLEQLTALNKNNPNFSFLFPESPYHSFFTQRLEAKLQNNPNIHPSAPLPNLQQLETDKKKPPSRWGTAVQFSPTNDTSNYSPQKHSGYTMPQPGSPMNYNAHNNLPNMGNMNPIYPNYYNNPQQGQFFNFNYNQQGSGATNIQPMTGFHIGNLPNPPAQGMPHMNPMMMFGNASASTAPLPTYMNQLQGQVRPPGDRKASLDKKDPGSGMETESPKSKGHRQYSNPEDVPVGIMADMLKQQAKRYKERNMTLKPYTPLDPDMTPQVIPPVSRVSDSVKTKLELFYKFLKDERDIDSLINKKRAGSIDMETLKNKLQNDKKKDLMGDARKAPVSDYQQAIINSEMGVRPDGQLINNVPGGGEERKGLGSSFDDPYSSFRKQRSHQYHVSAEERSVNRDAPELCFVCRMPGHLARDCKYGLS